MSKLQIPTARVFEPLLQPSRYKGAFGGRGSAKSHFFGGLMVEQCVMRAGTMGLCIREMQKDLKHSSKALIEGKIQEFGVGHSFRVLNDRIITPGGGQILFQGMQDHTSESVKSLEGFDIAWIEEAQVLSDRSLSLLRPTIRKEGSEIWASWNPRRHTDAVDHFLRTLKPTGSIVVQSNWRDNPWFTEALEAERQLDLDLYPERYDHIWEGGYAQAFEGAYYAKALAKAKAEGRIGRIAEDPIMRKVAYWDIGGAGKKADAMAIWIAQFVGHEIRVLDYIETIGQPLGFVVNELRRKGHDKIHCCLPHDGVNVNNVTGKRYEEHLRDAEFTTEVVPNQGAGAAMMRVEAARRVFPMVQFNEATTEAGRLALGYYHEKRDEHRRVGLGPEHDWSSNAADAFGLMAIRYEDPERTNRPVQIAAIDDMHPQGLFIRGGVNLRNFPDAIEE